MSMEDPNFWENILSKLLEPETQVIHDATVKVNEMLQNPRSIIFIFERLSNSNNLGVRHQAALLVRNRLPNLWEGLAQDVKNGMRDTLANIIMNVESPRVIRKASADIIGLIALMTVPDGSWPTYFPWVISLIQNDEKSEFREIGAYLLQQTLETSLQSHLVNGNFDNVKNIIDKCLRDSNADVRVRGVACAYAFIECLTLDSEVEVFLTLIPNVIGTIKLCVDDSDERVAIAFELLDYVAENHISQIKDILPDLLVFMLNIGSNQDITILIRQKALMFLEYVVTNRPKTFVNSNLLEPTINVSFLLMTEPQEEDFGEDTGSKYGSQLIDTIALTLPSQLVWPFFISKISDYLKHNKPEYRKAAINAIAILSEGCMEQIEDIFDDLMPCILNGFSQESEVKQASCIAIAEFSKNLPDLLFPYGNQLVPILLSGIQDPLDMVRIKTCYAISECSQSLKEYFMPHIEGLLQRLVEMMADKSVGVQEVAVSALSSVVEMAEEQIEPYFNPIINVLKKWMNITDARLFSVRARATECVATLATARKDLFLPQFEECIRVVLSGLDIDDVQLREYIYGYCEHMSRLFTEQLKPYVDGLIPYIFATIESAGGYASLGSEDTFTIMDTGDIDLQKLGKMVDEKDAAISLLGWLAFNYCSEFEKYISKAHQLLMEMSKLTFSPSTTSYALLALVQLCSCVQTLVDPEFGWVKGEQSPVHKIVGEMINTCLEAMLQNLDTTEDIIVRNALEAVSNLAQAFGPSAIPPDCINEIISIIMELLKREHPCQLVREAYDEDESELALFTVTMDTISRFARVYGQLFITPIEQFLMCLQPYLVPEATVDYKNVSIATIAEIAQELKDHFKPYCETFLPISIEMINAHSEKSVKHNAIYCSGLLAQYGGETTHKYFGSLTQALSPVCSLDPVKYNTVVDNACGALARMINSNPNIMPINDIMPIILNLLPLRDDMEPSIAIHEAIFNLIQANHSSVSNRNQLTNIFIVELLTTDIPKDHIRDKLIEFVKNEYKSHKDQIDGTLQQLVSQGIASQEVSSAFHSKLNS